MNEYEVFNGDVLFFLLLIESIIFGANFVKKNRQLFVQAEI